MPTDSFDEVLRNAMADFEANGYDSAERAAYWQEKLRLAAESMARPLSGFEQEMRAALNAIYASMVERGGILKRNPRIERRGLEMIRPSLRAELDRRILAAANLIKLNREQAIETTLRRFSGWSTSIPRGGSRAVESRDVKKAIRKPLANLPFIERRVAIDQGFKLRASISEIVATDTGAIAMIWHSHWRQPGYNYREDHKERDKRVYALRGCWALERGLMKPGADGYYDAITKVGEEIHCRCFAQWLYGLADLPDEMLTAKGREALAQARAA